MLLLNLIPTQATATETPKGSTWRYNYVDIYQGMTFVGSMRVTCTGTTTVTLLNQQYNAICYHTTLFANYTRDVHSSSNWISGSMDSSSDDYYDIQTNEEIGFLSYTNISVVSQQYLIPSIYYSERNESILTPPGGIGSEPSELIEGMNWGIQYVAKYDLTWTDAPPAINRTLSSEKTGTIQDNVTYTYVGERQIDVWAGNFACDVVKGNHTDGTVNTAWLCNETFEPVKVEYNYSSGEHVIYTLQDYSYTPKTAAPDSQSPDLLLLGAVVAIVVLGVILATFIFLRKKKSPPKSLDEMKPEQPAPPAI